MKIIQIIVLAMLNLHNVQAADETFPRTSQAEMTVVLQAYNEIKQQLQKTVTLEQRQELEAQQEILQKKIASLADALEKQEAEQPVLEEPKPVEQSVQEPATSSGDVKSTDTNNDHVLLNDLAMLEKELDWICSILLDQQSLQQAQSLKLDACVALLKTRIKQLKKADQANLESIIKQYALLDYFIQLQKNVAVRCEILTLGLNDSVNAIINEPLTREEYHQLLSTVFIELGEFFDELFVTADQWSIQDIEQYVHDKAILANLIRQHFPDELQVGLINRKFGLTDATRRAARAHALVALDLEFAYPELFIAYTHIMTSFNKHNFGSYKQLDEDFMNKLDAAINLFAERIISLKYDTQASRKMMRELLELLMTKLVKIKRMVMQAKKWNLDLIGDQQSTELSIAYALLVANKQYQQLFEHKPFVDIRSLFKTVVECYLANQATSESFFYDLYVLRAKLVELRDDCKAKSWFKWFKDGQHPAVTYLDRMFDLVHKIVIATTPTDTKEKAEPSVLQQIMSGNWWSSEKLKRLSKDGKGQFVLELVDDMQKRQFTDLKATAFHALSGLSPLLMMGLMKYLLPYVSKELGKKMMEFITDQEQTRKSIDGNKVVDFIVNNPAVYEEFSRKHPDLVEEIARQAANKMPV